MSDPIAALRALHEEATPAPWEERSAGCFITGPDNGAFVVATDGSLDEDTRLIVAVRNNLPALLDAAEWLRSIRTWGSSPAGTRCAFCPATWPPGSSASARHYRTCRMTKIDAVLSRLHVEDTP